MSEYFIGLDIGTDSVGWAVTTPDYRVVKKNGKALWGVRLFESAQNEKDKNKKTPMAERRGHRSARRRLERRKQRISMIRAYFSEEIAKIDPAFFLRLDESKFHPEDKKLTDDGMPLGKHLLFTGSAYNDKQYHKDYPTIYHLRHALMTQEREFDVRLVYLAVHHIIKNRGHFLQPDMNIEDVQSFDLCWNALIDYLREESDAEDVPVISFADIKGIEDILLSRDLRAKEKKKLLCEKAGLNQKNDAHKQLCAILGLISGNTESAATVCRLRIPAQEDMKVSFSDFDEEKEGKLAELVGESMELMNIIRGVFDWAVLNQMTHGNSSISEERIKTYECHRQDLKDLKAVFGTDRKLYNEVFRKEGMDNYPSYIGHTKRKSNFKYEDFCKFVKKRVEMVKNGLHGELREKAEKILQRLEDGTFMPKQTNRDNGVIPHQLHEYELKVILDRASRYLPFLNEIDESGLACKERIMAIFRFRIPYYVGPLTSKGAKKPEENGRKDRKKQNCWVVRTDEKITPWNFEQVVDLEKCAENFVTRMTAVCTYIGEPILPKDSLLYSRFMVLNAINKIRINGDLISPELKQRIYNEHILAQGKTSYAQIRRFMLANGLMQKGDELTGIDEEFKATLTGYKTFKQILSKGGNEEMIEDIIRHIVLFSEEKKRLAIWMEKTYGNRLGEGDCDYVLKQCGRFKGWGKLSAEFLTEIKHADSETGELLSIDDMLWQTSDNLNELLSDKYSFMQAVREYRAGKAGANRDTLEDVLDNSYVSPNIRRAIHQTIGVISEIEKIMRGKPKRVFVEVAREKGKEGRVPSRKRELEALYAKCSGEVEAICEQLGLENEGNLRSKKLYLYYKQKAQCMYSGEPIKLSELMTSNGRYDIDHIYPQSLVKEDSLDNMVLVKKSLNQEKSNDLLSPKIRSDRRPFWEELKREGFISEEKFKRLTRREPFGEEERAGFIARQLVEMRQSTKVIAHLLEERYGEASEVVYVKAGNVSAFRQDQHILPDGTRIDASVCKRDDSKQDPLFVKCREVNDFHHAKDAYLNIVVGNVYHMKFTRSPITFIRSGQPYSMNCVFARDVIRNGECAWKAGDEGSIAMVRSMMRKNNILFTRYTHEAAGKLFDANIVSKRKGLTRIKESDPRLTTEKYGGYDKARTAYFFFAEHTEGKKRIRSIETVLIMHKEMYEKNPELYCEMMCGLIEPRVLIRKIPIDSLISYDGYRMFMASRSNDNIFYNNAHQLVIDNEMCSYVKQLAKSKKTGILVKGITAEKNTELYDLIRSKLSATIYRIKYETPLKHLDSLRENFVSAAIKDQVEALMQIMNLFTTSTVKKDLKIIGGKATGQLSLSKRLDVSGKHKVILIHQSITGFFEQEIDLLGEF
ncbi:MAG: type II CRISPR RNA-guided endonuclease Cas9 [Clostridia bacterium]|nr:type II CRISPR RNA-guided endonuclease Cas9 [Clostridia bacterium]